MAYTDQILNLPVVTGTSTASATTGVAVTAQLGDLVRAKIVNQMRVNILAAPATGVTALAVVVKAGTNTIGSATIGTNTAGSGVDATLTAANVNIPDRTALTAVFTGTATASGQSIGTYAVQVQ